MQDTVLEAAEAKAKSDVVSHLEVYCAARGVGCTWHMLDHCWWKE